MWKNVRIMTRPPPLIDAIESPHQPGRRPAGGWRRAADRLRSERMSAVAVTAGHPRAGRGVAELTLALHQVLDTRGDRLVRDVGQRTERHKIPTGQRQRTPAANWAGMRLCATHVAAVRP
jgi:deoxyxylulose-5-phosphate synthase